MNPTTYYRGHKVCLKCGMRVQISRTKAGKDYLSGMDEPSIHGGSFARAHRCDLWDKNDGAFLWHKQAIENGEIVLEQVVTVVKGRKVAKGTSGVVTYVGEGDYGLRVGFKNEQGEVFYTAATNVVAVNQIERVEE